MNATERIKALTFGMGSDREKYGFNECKLKVLAILEEEKPVENIPFAKWVFDTFDYWPVSDELSNEQLLEIYKQTLK